MVYVSAKDQEQPVGNNIYIQLQYTSLRTQLLQVNIS